MTLLLNNPTKKYMDGAKYAQTPYNLPSRIPRPWVEPKFCAIAIETSTAHISAHTFLL